MQKQINDFIISFLSPYLCGYRRGFNIGKGFGGAILMDLSNAFNTVTSYELRVASCEFLF